MADSSCHEALSRLTSFTSHANKRNFCSWSCGHSWNRFCLFCSVGIRGNKDGSYLDFLWPIRDRYNILLIDAVSKLQQSSNTIWLTTLINKLFLSIEFSAHCSDIQAVRSLSQLAGAAEWAERLWRYVYKQTIFPYLVNTGRDCLFAINRSANYMVDHLSTSQCDSFSSWEDAAKCQHSACLHSWTSFCDIFNCRIS